MHPADDPMAELRATFYAECDELLEVAQEGLLAMQDGSADAEAIHSVFRAVHSIKGAAGAFKLDDVVDFAHAFETVLAAIRSGDLTSDGNVILLLLRACDGLTDLVAAARDRTAHDPGRIEATRANLHALSDRRETAETPSPAFTVTKLSLDLNPPGDPKPAAAPPSQRYRIAFLPEDALYGLGNEPLFLFRALARLGTLDVHKETVALPQIDVFEPGKSYLCWMLHLTTEAPEADIREVFEFVEDLCTLQIARAGAPTVATPRAEDAPQAPDHTPSTAPEANHPSASQAVTPKQRTSPATVRVDLDRVDRLGNLVGELVIQQAMLSQDILDAGLTASSPVTQSLEKLTALTRDAQSSVMMIRAQPLKSLFQRMSRIVREASAAAGKPARLSLEGEGTEIDKAVIEGLADPLTHMLRNAVDHGLEPPQARAAAGKPAEGTIRITAAHRSGRVLIELSDDGCGIDRPKVLETAVARGLVAAGAQLCDAEIDKLLFLPGFSTAGEVSSLSGRGVGMDVVRGAIQALGGRIAIRSEPGVGTTFSISLPLTLAVLDGIIVEVAGERLVLPVHTIVETLTLAGGDVSTLAPGTSVALIRGEILTLLDLGAELGFRAPTQRVAGAQALVIAMEGDARVALIVDAVQTQRQVVIKGLQENLGHIPGVSAATILGDGQIALILDPLEIATRAGPPLEMSPTG